MLVIKDFATTTLASALTAVATTITVANGSKFPALAVGDYFYVVLQDFYDRNLVEVVKVTGVSGNVLTVVRGQDGTVGRAFAVGAYAELRLTVRTFAEFIAQSNVGNLAWGVATASVVAQPNKGYLVNAAGLTITLPNAPVSGQTVGIGDYNGSNHSVTIARNGSNIMGRAENFIFNLENANVVFVYIDSTFGWMLSQGFGESQVPYAVFNKLHRTNVLGQKIFPFASTAANTVDVYYNGWKLDPASDYTTTTAEVTLSTPVSSADDVIEIYGWNQALVLNASGITYDNAATSISAGTMQQAIDSVCSAVTTYEGIISEPPAWVDVPEHSDLVLGVALDAQAKALVARSELLKVLAGEVAHLSSYAALRTYTGTAKTAMVACRSVIFDGAEGIFSLITSDTSSADDDGSILIDALGRRWKRNLDAGANPRWWGAKGDGVADDTNPIKSALASKAKRVSAGIGVFRFTSKLTVPLYKILEGSGYATDPGIASTILLKDGNFTGVEVYDAAQLCNISVEGADGNGGDGVHQRGGRSKLSNVSSFKHGQDGFKIGAYAGSVANTNLWRAENLIAEVNGRHGCYISDDNNDWNCNAGLLVGYDASRNGGDGLAIGKAGANQGFGVACQVNTGYGVHYLNGAMGNYLSAPYTEANTTGDVCFDVGADQNFHLGVRPGVNHGNITNNGANNTIWNRNSQFANTHDTTEHFKDIFVSSFNTSGRWRLVNEETTRNLLFQLQDTSASASVVLKSIGGGVVGLKLNDSSGALQGSVVRGLTLNFGLIAANSTSEQSTTIAGADATWIYTVNPTYAIPAGIVWSVYHNGTSIVVRCANVTGAAVTVSGGFRIVGQKVV